MRPNAWVGLAAVVLGVLYGIQAWHLPKALIGNPWAPVYFPLGLGILMTVLGALLLFQEARKGLTNLEGTKPPRFDRRSLGLIGAVA
uniref:tripartite tricarboxylate transporter TctB family protein n=1 Tax=Aminomonas paucivorans TaxID=81412 RepID=UPI0033241479